MSLDHQIIWNQLTCEDLEAGIAFYEQLFGWTTRPEERATYVHFYQGDQTVAGVMPKHGGGDAPNHWAVHVGTSDIEAYKQRAEAAGGQPLTPVMDIPSTGKLLAVSDPGGAVLIAFQPAHPERDSWGPSQKPGHFCWVELMSSDLSKSLPFYQEVVGWKSQPVSMGDFDYTFLAAPDAQEGEAIGGAVTKPAPEIPDHWLPYVAVESVEATHAKALELGGSSCHGPTEIPGYGRFAVLQDPQGAVFAVYQGQGS